MKDLGLLFDMDGVIINNHHYHFLAWKKLGQDHDISFDETFYREKMNGRTLNELMKLLFKAPLSDQEMRKIGEKKEQIYRELYREFLSPTAGLMEFLETCKSAQIPMVVGTSAPLANVEFTLDGLGIRHYFQAALDERAVTKGKPDPQIYQKCAAAINKKPENCVVFEDALSGIQAGKAAGAKVVALATSHRREELTGDLIIDDFTGLELKQIHQLFV